MYCVYDKEGNFIKKFSSYEDAFTFLIVMQRYDWSIKHQI